MQKENEEKNKRKREQDEIQRIQQENYEMEQRAKNEYNLKKRQNRMVYESFVKEPQIFPKYEEPKEKVIETETILVQPLYSIPKNLNDKIDESIQSNVYNQMIKVQKVVKESNSVLKEEILRMRNHLGELDIKNRQMEDEMKKISRSKRNQRKLQEIQYKEIQNSILKSLPQNKNKILNYDGKYYFNSPYIDNDKIRGSVQNLKKIINFQDPYNQLRDFQKRIDFRDQQELENDYLHHTKQYKDFILRKKGTDQFLNYNYTENYEQPDKYNQLNNNNQSSQKSFKNSSIFQNKAEQLDLDIFVKQRRSNQIENYYQQSQERFANLSTQDIFPQQTILLKDDPLKNIKAEENINYLNLNGNNIDEFLYDIDYYQKRYNNI